MIEWEWTGERCITRALLYLSYTDRANVLFEGRVVGSVFRLENGKFRPSIDGIRGEDRSTAKAAARETVKLWKEFRS